MTTTIIILLLLLGVVLIVAELLFIPGFTVAGIGAICSFIASIVIASKHLGTTWALIILAIAIVLSAATLIVCTRRKAMAKLTLDDKIGGKAQENAHEKIAIGTLINTSSRLAPMGTITINGKVVEAKSISGYIGPKTSVKVVGYEDSIVLVELA